MWRYLQMHEKLIRDLLAADDPNTDWAGVLAHHYLVIEQMQKERLIHLIVTFFFALFMMLCVGFTFAYPRLPVFLMSLLFLIMTMAYVNHYFRLENGVQRWYVLGHRLAAKAGILTADYQGQEPLLIPAKKVQK